MTKITSEVQILSDLLASQCFSVPWHQRYYDWSREEVRELIDDISDAMSHQKPCYFIGSVMLVKSMATPTRTINDGQQRLITLSLLIAALSRRFKTIGDGFNEDRALRLLFHRTHDEESTQFELAETESYKPRITLHDNDRMSYNQVIRGHSIGSNGKLVGAFDEIDSFVESFIEPPEIARFFDFLIHRVEVSVLTIPSDIDANAFFEALNARGKSLDDVDLIRNRIYSYFSNENEDQRLATVHDCLTSASIVSRSPEKRREYFRCYLQCRYGHLRKQRFYRDVRTRIDTAGGDDIEKHVLDLVGGLGNKANVELFRHITSKRGNHEIHSRFPQIIDLQRYAVSSPIVFALVYRWCSERNAKNRRKIRKSVNDSLQNIKAFVFRTALVSTKFEPSMVDEPFAHLACDIFNGSEIASLDVLPALRKTDKKRVISNASFVRQMEIIELRDRRALSFLLGINETMQRGTNVLREECSVEHVLPVSTDHWKQWESFADRGDAGAFVYRTGNLVILPKAENRPDREYNGSYAVKRKCFEESVLAMPKDVAQQYGEWTPEVVEERSRALARSAAEAWEFVDRRRRKGKSSIK